MVAGKENDISRLSFEDAIKELTAIVGKIEQGEIACRTAYSSTRKAWP